MSIDNLISTKPVHDLARLSYVQDLVVHRRVLLIGASRELAEFLLASRARYVCSIGNEMPAATDSGAQNLEFKVMDPADLKLRDGTFDVAIIRDLTALASAADVLNEARRVLGPRGHLVVASPNPSSQERIGPIPAGRMLDYYEMFDLLAAVFPVVQMVGQSPFVGYAIADLSSEDEEPQVGFDSALIGEGGEEIEWFLAVCGDEPVELPPYAVVQIPLKDAGLGSKVGEQLAALEAEAGESTRAAGEARAELTREKTAFEEALRCEREAFDRERRNHEDALAGERTRADGLEQAAAQVARFEEILQQARLELGNRGVRIETLEKDIERERNEAAAARERAVQIAKQFDDERKNAQAKRLEEEMARRSGEMAREARVRELEQELRLAQARANSAEAAHDAIVQRMRADAAELDRLREQQDDAEDDRRRLAERESRLVGDLEKLREELARAVARASEADALRAEAASRVEAFDRDREALADEMAVLESRLRDTGRALAEAEAEALRREGIVRDLVVELEASSVGNAGFAERVDALMETVAELRGANVGLARASAEAEATIRELEGRVAAGASAGELEEATAEIARRGEILTSLAHELEDVKGRNDDLMFALAEARTRFESGSSVVVDRDRRIAELEGELQASRWRASELEARGADHERRLSEAMVAAERMEVELAATRGARQGQHRARVEAELAAASFELARQRAERELIAAQNHVLEIEESLAEARGARQGQHRARVEAELAAGAAEVREKRAIADLAAARDRIAMLEVDLGTTQERVVELEHKAISGAPRNLYLDSGPEPGAAIEDLASAGAAATHLWHDLEAERTRTEESMRALEEAEGRIAQLTREVEEAKDVAAKRAVEEAELRGRVEALSKTLAAAERNARLLDDERDGMRERAERLAADLAAAGERIVGLKTEIDAASGGNARLESRLAEAEERAREATRTSAETGSRLAELTAQAEAAETARLAVEAELDGAREQAAIAAAALAKTRDGFQKELSSGSAAASELEQRVRDLTRAVAEAEQRAESESSRGATALASLERLRAELAGEMERTGEAGADAARLAGEVADLGERLARREQDLKERIAERDASERALAALRADLADVGAQVEGAREAAAAERVRSSSLLAEIERYADFEEQMAAHAAQLERAEEERSRLEDDASRMKEELEASRAAAESAAARSDQFHALLDEQRARLREIEEEQDAGQTELETLRAEAARLQAEVDQAASSPQPGGSAESNEEVAELRLEAAKQAEEIRRLAGEAREREPLLSSLTAQLEEREKRATRLERQIREMERQIKEHDSDIAAWEMELKFRNARITQLEADLARAKERQAEGEARLSRPPIKSVLPAGATDLDELRRQADKLNEALGDKDAELLVLHGQTEDLRRRLGRIRETVVDAIGAERSVIDEKIDEIVTILETE
ncbi:MAG: methyltransferase domain-containing protein [Deltaproteobacteria bacterium]|nr:methyltransferase domain-containing protein [Deltaproteobacteria bacterium]